MSTNESAKPTLDFSPEAIDGMVITLDNAFQMAGDQMPDYVKNSGQDFIKNLNRWSEEKKKQQS
jgi:hypothetical protein